MTSTLFLNRLRGILIHMQHKPSYILCFQLCSKTQRNTCMVAWLRCRALKKDSNSLTGFCFILCCFSMAERFSCLPFLWLGAFRPEFKFFLWLYHLTLFLNTFIWLKKSLNQCLSANFFFFWKYILNEDLFPTNTALTHIPTQKYRFLAQFHFSSLPSVFCHSLLSFWQSHKLV